MCGVWGTVYKTYLGLSDFTIVSREASLKQLTDLERTSLKDFLELHQQL